MKKGEMVFQRSSLDLQQFAQAKEVTTCVMDLWKQKENQHKH